MAEAKRTTPVELALGRLAVENDLITRAQMDECLAIQADLAARGYPSFLGRILVQKHYLDRVRVAAVLKSIGTDRGDPIDVDTRINLIKLTEDEHRVLLARAREGNLLSVEQIDRCYDLQIALESHGIDEQLGEILLAVGYLSREVIDGLVGAAPAAPSPTGPKRIRLGELAIEKNLITAEHLERDLGTQERMRSMGIHRRLGEIFIARKRLAAPDVRRLLELQKDRQGAIPRREAARVQAVAPADAALARVLSAKKLVSQHELEECQFIQKDLRELGIEQSLGGVLVERGYLEADVLDEIERRRNETSLAVPLGAEAVKMGKRPVKSEALSDSYREVVEELGAGGGPVPPRKTRSRVRPAKRGLPVGLLAAGGGAVVTAIVLLASVVGRDVASSALAPGADPAAVPVTPGSGDEAEAIASGAIEDEATFAARLASIDAALDEWRFTEADARCAVLKSVEERPDWTLEAGRRAEASRGMARFAKALELAVGRAAPVEARLGALGLCRIVRASAEGIQVDLEDEGGSRMVRWPRCPAEDLAALAEQLGLGTLEPVGMLHYVVHHQVDRPIDRLAGAALAARPESEDEILALVARRLGVADPGDLVVLADRVVTREEAEAILAEPGSGAPAGGTGELEENLPGAADLVRLEVIRSEATDLLLRHDFAGAAKIAREGLAAIEGDAEAGRTFRWFLEGTIAEVRLHEALLAAVRERAKAGRPLAVAYEGHRAEVLEATGEGLTLQIGEQATLTIPWSKVDGPIYLALLSGLRSELGDDWLEVAGAYARRGQGVEAMDLLVSLHRRGGEWRERVDAYLAAWRGLDGVPAGGYVEWEGSLVPAVERDLSAEAARQNDAAQRAELARFEDEAKVDRADRILASAMDALEKGRFEYGHKVLREWVEAFPQHAEAERVGRMARPNAILASRLERGSGPPENRVDVYVCGEGYLLKDYRQRTFADQARRNIDGLLRMEPYREYASFFKFHLVYGISEEEEVSTPDEARSTLFGACKLADGPQVDVDRLRTRALLDQTFPKAWDTALVQVHRGSLGIGGSDIAAFAEGDLTTAIHEFGHSFTGLLDEYSLSPTGFGLPPGFGDTGINLTDRTDLETCPWRHWIEAGEPGIGFHEGGAGRTKGLWHPSSRGCIMGTSTAFHCAVCREAIVLEIYRRVRPVDRAEPDPATPIQLVRGSTKDVVLRVVVLKPATHAIDVEWTVDGIKPSAKDIRTDAFQDPRTREWVVETTLPAHLFIGRGSRVVTATVVDRTPWVKLDKDKRLRQEVKWTVESAD